MLHIDQHQRLRQIQKSNLHVKNLIESAKRMIYNQDKLGKNQKEILEVKISIEKDHLKNSFYKINCPENSFNLQIIEKNSQKPFSKPSSFNNTIKLETSQPFDQQNQNRCKQTKIVISRIVEKQSLSKRIAVNSPLLFKQTQFTEGYQREKQTARTYTIEQPENNTKIVIKTSQESILQNDHTKITQSPSRIDNKSSQYQPKQSVISSTSKQQRFQIQQYLNKEPYFQQQISLSTPQRTYKIKNTQTVEDFNHQASQRKMENRFQRDKFEENQQKSSRRSTSYKQILQNNKQKLKDSREKSQTVLRNPSYKLNLQKLYEKKQEGKKRLYGQNYENKSTQLNSGSGSHSKYSIANSQRTKKQSSSNLMSGRSMNRQKSKTFRSNRSQLSQQKNNSLHSKLIKGIHMPCTSPCLKCKNRMKHIKQKQQPLSQFHLAKKYLTPQGQKECYNFLRSQGIEEKDWPIFITQYVYRQLSKAYNQYSPKETQQTE